MIAAGALGVALATSGCGATCERVQTFGHTINAYADQAAWTLSEGSLDDVFAPPSQLPGARIVDLKRGGATAYGPFFVDAPVRRDADGCEYFLVVDVDPEGIVEALAGIDVLDLDGSELEVAQRIELTARLRYEPRGQTDPGACRIDWAPEDSGHSSTGDFRIVVFQRQSETGKRFYLADDYASIDDHFMELAGAFVFEGTAVGEVSVSVEAKLAARQSLIEEVGSADCVFADTTERVAEDW